jgi:hypothetical protein
MVAMRRVRFGRVPRLLAVVLVMALAMLGLGVGATPASALNHESYNILRNAGQHHYCLDIRTEDNPVGARAHLWTCTKDPRPPEQQFLLVTDVFGHDHIKVQRSGYCLYAQFDKMIVQLQCGSGLDFINQSWVLRDTGEIVNAGTGDCLDTTPADTKDATVVDSPCNGSISQRWFF